MFDSAGLIDFARRGKYIFPKSCGNISGLRRVRFYVACRFYFRVSIFDGKEKEKGGGRKGRSNTVTKTDERNVRVHNGICCSNETRQDSLVIDRKARRVCARERMKGSYMRKREQAGAAEPVSAVSIIPNGSRGASRRSRRGDIFVLSALLRSLLIRRLLFFLILSTPRRGNQ